MKRTAGVVALLALLLSALVIEGVPVLHAHEADQPAIYNEECPLAGLAAHSTSAPLPSMDSAAISLISGNAPDLTRHRVPPSLLLASADSRTPPAR